MDKTNRVLIIDDEKINIEILTQFLQNEYKIVTARTGKQALKAIRGQNPPDLILLDIIIPDMDGYEICSAVKADENCRHIPIIFVTAVSEVMDSAKAFDFGAVDYITKPFNPVTVKARVDTHIQLSNAMRELKSALTKVKQLSGLLPICGQCKKIRDDKGYWNEVEFYLEENSKAKFTHGMCPDCLDELYGDRDWYKKMKKAKPSG